MPVRKAGLKCAPYESGRAWTSRTYTVKLGRITTAMLWTAALTTTLICSLMLGGA